MKMNPLRSNNDQRAVSTVVGIALIIGFTVAVGIALFLFGQGLIQGNEDPRVNSEFELRFEGQDEIELRYATGEPFTPQNTERLFIAGTDSNGNSYTITLYDGNSVNDQYYSNPPSELKTGMVAVGQDRMRNRDVQARSTIQVVWEPASQENTQTVLDELVIPDVDTILQQIDQEGTFSSSGDVVIGGCNPEVESCSP